MADYAKVVGGLKKLHGNCGCLTVYENDCATCPYRDVNGCCSAIIVDAIALLEEQHKELAFVRNALRDMVKHAT